MSEKFQNPKILLIGILILSLILNTTGIWYTTPRCAYPDEESFITRALEVGYIVVSKGIVQGLYAYAFPKSLGPTLIYISVPMGIYLATTAITGELSGIIKSASAIHHRADFYSALPDNILTGIIISARVTSAIFATATVFVVYLIGREIWGEKKGLIPAAIVALTAGFVNLAHEVEETMPMTFFLTLTLYYVLKHRKYGDVKYFFYSCVAAGVAIATKFNAGIVLIPMFLGYYMGRGENRRFAWKHLLIGFLLLTISFSILRIGVVLDLYRFAHYVIFAALGKFSGGFRETYGVAVPVTPVWILQTLNLINGMGLPLFLLFAVSLIFALRRRGDFEVLLLSFIIPYVLVISFWSVAPFHFVVPIFPFAALLIGDFIISLANTEHKQRKLVYAIFAIVLIHAAFYTVMGDVKYLHDSRDIATEWMEKNVPRGAVVETYTLSLTYIPRTPDGVKLVGYPEHIKIYSDPFNITNPAQYIEMEKNYTVNYMYSVTKRKPDYIVISSRNFAQLFLSHTPFEKRKEFYQKLLNGEIDSYKIVAVFGKPLDEVTKINILQRIVKSLISPDMENVNPTIVILKRG